MCHSLPDSYTEWYLNGAALSKVLYPHANALTWKNWFNLGLRSCFTDPRFSLTQGYGGIVVLRRRRWQHRQAQRENIKSWYGPLRKKRTPLKYTCNKQSGCSRHALCQWRIFAAIDYFKIISLYLYTWCFKLVILRRHPSFHSIASGPQKSNLCFFF